MASDQGLLTSIDGRGIYPKWHSLGCNVRQQMADTAFNKKFMASTQSSSESAKTVLIIALVMNVFLGGAF